jgi:hypothetical protein
MPGLFLRRATRGMPMTSMIVRELRKLKSHEMKEKEEMHACTKEKNAKKNNRKETRKRKRKRTMTMRLLLRR